MKFFLLIVCILINGIVSAQVGPFTAPPTGPTFLRDVFRNRYIDPKPEGNVEGSVFLENKWVYGRIKAAGRIQTYDSVKLKLNIENGTVHFLDENNEEMTTTLQVEAILITDQNSGYNQTIFFSNLNQQRGFYQLIDDSGKLKLFKKLRLYKWESMPVNSEKIKHLEIEGDWVLTYNDKFVSLQKNCNTLKEIFADNTSMIKFITENKLHCNQESDLKKLVQFYASQQ